jgi:hypothetical protein
MDTKPAYLSVFTVKQPLSHIQVKASDSSFNPITRSITYHHRNKQMICKITIERDVK